MQSKGCVGPSFCKQVDQLFITSGDPEEIQVIQKSSGDPKVFINPVGAVGSEVLATISKIPWATRLVALCNRKTFDLFSEVDGETFVN